MTTNEPKISDLVLGAKNLLEAADIRPGDSVLLLADRQSDPDSTDALTAVLRLHGAYPLELIMDSVPRYGEVVEVALRAMEVADVVIWMWPVFLTFVPNYRERLRKPKEDEVGAPKERARPYMVYFEGWPGLLATDYARFPNELLWTIAKKVKEVVSRGSRVKITGPKGTVLQAEYDGSRLYALQTKPGEPAGRCHFPWGRCGVYNGSGNAEGTVQLDCVQGVPGRLDPPMIWTVKGGKVVDVEGGGEAGDECKRLLREFPGSNGFTEVMFGYHPKASTERGIQDPMHWEIISRHPWVGLGTHRREIHYRHVDGGCIGASLSIDDRVIVEPGGRLSLLEDPEIRSVAQRCGDTQLLLSSVSHTGRSPGGFW